MQKYLIMLILGSGLLVGQRSAAFAQGDNTFRGKALPQVLRPSATVSCFSDTSANTGYYRNPYPEPGKPEVVLKSSPLETQTAGGGYKISFNGNQATVVDEVMKQSYQFQVYQRRDDGVILVRFKGIGIEIITIDPLNGSFVLTDSGVQTLWNRANVWTGRCY
ncbi:MAG: hypothetical protein WD688_20905 [Candidatus Binatia bacterium]